jgi:photosystem II stability/assembly factor-like uncharacterized protein
VSGVYRSRDGGDTWSRVMGKDQFNGRAVGSMAIKPVPNAAVADLVLVPERDVLYAATHGQGVWQLNVR